MQAVKPEWASLQAQFTPLALSDRLSCIINELKALQRAIEVQHYEAINDDSNLPRFLLRKIQRYVEWTVPELLPDRAEEAEILVNISRFAARLLIQKEAWITSNIATEIEQQVKQISTIQNIN